MSKEPWHLNRSVPVTLIFAIVIQAAAITLVESRLESKTDSLAAAIQTQAVTLARIEEALKNIHPQLRELKQRRP